MSSSWDASESDPYLDPVTANIVKARQYSCQRQLSASHTQCPEPRILKQAIGGLWPMAYGPVVS